MIDLQNQSRKLKFLIIAILIVLALLITVVIYWPNTTANTTINFSNTSKGPVKSKISLQTRNKSNTEALHNNVIATVFWVGESASDENGYISNESSAWDEHWQQNYGGVDSLSNRNNFRPRENPYYIALPYNDVNPDGNRKSTAKFCPNATNPNLQHYSWCKNSWVALTRADKTVYAQWEDVGPYQENDVAYVFGNKAPINKIGAFAGIDISPSVRDLLGVGDVSHINWRFVSTKDVPNGPWKQIITTSPGEIVD